MLGLVQSRTPRRVCTATGQRSCAKGEDPSVVWDEERSPYRAVATLVVEPQPAWVYGESEREEDRLLFSPWHGLAAHQPLGGVNRVRREALSVLCRLSR